MSIAALIATLEERGVDAETILAAVKAVAVNATSVRSAGAERQARYRANKAESVTRDVTRDVTPPSFPLVPPALPPEPPFSPPYNPPTNPLSGGRADTPQRQPDRFEEFWNAYPKRDGANPKEPARKRFIAAIKSGVGAEAIIAGAKAYAASEAKRGNVGSPYIAQAVTWLNQCRWQDAAEAPSTAPATGPPCVSAIHINPIDHSDAWQAWRAHRGKELPRDKAGGWMVPSLLPPEERNLQ